MKSKKQTAVSIALIGAFIVYWAENHSPEADIAQILVNELSGSYSMSEPAFYLTLLVGIGLIVLGIYRFVRG